MTTQTTKQPIGSINFGSINLTVYSEFDTRPMPETKSETVRKGEMIPSRESFTNQPS